VPRAQQDSIKIKTVNRIAKPTAHLDPTSPLTKQPAPPATKDSTKINTTNPIANTAPHQSTATKNNAHLNQIVSPAFQEPTTIKKVHPPASVSSQTDQHQTLTRALAAANRVQHHQV